MKDTQEKLHRALLDYDRQIGVTGTTVHRARTVELIEQLIEQFVHKAVMAAIAEHESRYHQRRGTAGSEVEDRPS